MPYPHAEPERGFPSSPAEDRYHGLKDYRGLKDEQARSRKRKARRGPRAGDRPPEPAGRKGPGPKPSQDGGK